MYTAHASSDMLIWVQRRRCLVHGYVISSHGILWDKIAHQARCFCSITYNILYNFGGSGSSNYFAKKYKSNHISVMKDIFPLVVWNKDTIVMLWWLPEKTKSNLAGNLMAIGLSGLLLGFDGTVGGGKCCLILTLLIISGFSHAMHMFAHKQLLKRKVYFHYCAMQHNTL